MNVPQLKTAYSLHTEVVVSDRLLALIQHWSGYSIELAFSRGVMPILLEAQIHALFHYAGETVVRDYYNNYFGDTILKMEIANEK